MTYLKDIIEIPQHIDKGQFVLRLSEGVSDDHVRATVDSYVVTRQLRGCFDDALRFIHGAVQGATGKATYLHGSFGSGKSHFMAILHLLLQGNTVAKGIPELASVVQNHNDWLGGKRFLLVPYHMIGAHDVESGKHGNRVRYVRRVLFEQLGIVGDGEFEHHREFFWKNTKRSCVVLFKNIRELNDPSFENSEDGDWKIVIDFPCDEPGHGPRDDLSKLQAFRESHPAGAKTLCWVPQFFSDEARKDLGLLVILEHILTGERFSQYSGHLSAQDRQAAKASLENQRSQLRQRVQNHLDAAYGLESITAGSLDTTHELDQHEQFVSLWSQFEPQPPVASNLGSALQHLLEQALDCEFPAAPDFESEVKDSSLKKVHEVVSQAIQATDGRVAVDKALRPLMRHLANPLQLGEMGHDATHFVLGHHWRNHFNKKAAEAGGTITVAQLRRWIDQPRAMGLPTAVQNLVILCFAEQTDRTVMRHGAAWDATLANLPNDCELREQQLPHERHWKIALDRAGSIFGEAPSPLRNASNVAKLASGVKQKADEHRKKCQAYCQQLKERMSRLDIDAEASDRMRTALATLGLVERIHAVREDDVVETLFKAEIATTEAAMGECRGKAGELMGMIHSANWEICEAISKLSGEPAKQAESILESVKQALVSDEHVIELAPALASAQSHALRLITDATKQPQETPPPETGTPAGLPSKKPRKSEKRVVGQDSRENVDLSTAMKLLAELERGLQRGQAIRLNVSWIIEEDGGDS